MGLESRRKHRIYRTTTGKSQKLKNSFLVKATSCTVLELNQSTNRKNYPKQQLNVPPSEENALTNIFWQIHIYEHVPLLLHSKENYWRPEG